MREKKERERRHSHPIPKDTHQAQSGTIPEGPPERGTHALPFLPGCLDYQGYSLIIPLLSLTHSLIIPSSR
jgi:hypothetical protein